MASFVDILNQGLGGLNTPLGQLGTQMLMNSGYQRGDPGAGARLGQSLAGMSDMQRQQALQQYRQQQMSLLEQQQAAHVQAAQAKARQQQEYQQRLQDPNFLASLSPTARQFAQLGVDPSELLRATAADNLTQHRQAALQQQQGQFDMRQAHQGSGGGQAQGPRMPTQRQVLEKPLGGGMVQRYVLDQQTGQYQEYGQPYPQYSPPRGKAAQAAAVDPLEAIVQHATGGGAPAEGGLGSVPGAGSLQSYAPAPQGADLLMRRSANPTPSIITGGANPNAAREGMRVPGQPKVATPMTKAEYDQLPSGSQYVDPVSGRVAVKK